MVKPKYSSHSLVQMVVIPPTKHVKMRKVGTAGKGTITGMLRPHIIALICNAI